MELFYSNLWLEEMPKAEALWAAKKALRDEGHEPRDWAGWILTGDPNCRDEPGFRSERNRSLRRPSSMCGTSPRGCGLCLVAKKKPMARASVQDIEQSIYLIRGEKVMLDFDLAKLYGVETRALVQAVKRNPRRFPEDFMFQLERHELDHWRSQFVISNPGARMGLRRAPYAFTEQGVAMLSSVLRSDRAVDVNVQIMRTFVRLRELMLTHRDLARKLAELETKYDDQFAVVFEAIRELMEPPPEEANRRIGFR